jgi:hypothetical protein
MPTGAAEVGGFDEDRVGEGRFHGVGVERAAVLSDVLGNGQAAFGADAFEQLLVHGHGRGHDAGADVREVGEFEQALHGAVFTEGAVEDREDDVDAGVGAGGGGWARGSIGLRAK